VEVNGEKGLIWALELRMTGERGTPQTTNERDETRGSESSHRKGGNKNGLNKAKEKMYAFAEIHADTGICVGSCFQIILIKLTVGKSCGWWYKLGIFKKRSRLKRKV